MKYLLLIVISVTSCGSEYKDHIFVQDRNNHKSISVNDEFKPYVEKFKELYSLNFHIRVEFEDLEKTYVGMCYYWDDGHREIGIDQDRWQRLSADEREVLIFHELGHCILNRDHVEELGHVGKYENAPKSIMHPYIFSDPYYALNRQYYFNELITNRQ